MSEPNEQSPAQESQGGPPPPPPPPAASPGAPSPESDQGPQASPGEPLPTFMWSPREEKWAGQMSSDDKTMGLLAHLLGIFTGFIGPLVIWLIKKDTSPYVDAQGKESLNFQISILIYAIVSYASVFALVGCVLFPAVAIFAVVMPIIASVKANEGIVYRYPLAIRFIT